MIFRVQITFSSYRLDHSYTIYRGVPNTPRHLAGGFVDQWRNENLFAAKQPGKRRKTETFSFLFPIPLTALSQMKSRSSVYKKFVFSKIVFFRILKLNKTEVTEAEQEILV